MDPAKRKTVCDGESDNRKRAKAAEKVDATADATAARPADEEVDEFFAILRRIQVAVKYFQKRNGGGRRELMAPPWNPSFEPHDFDGVKEKGEKSEGDQNTGLDLNSDPVSDDPDIVSNPV